MYKKHSIKTLVTVGLLLISTVGLLVPSISASPTIDEVDGIWTDDFVYDNQEELDENLSYINCTVDYTNGTVSLIKTPGGLTQDFKGTGHTAYSYRSFVFRTGFLFSPGFHSIWESLFDDESIDNIKNLREDPDDDYRYASSSSSKKYVAHHFKLKIASDSNNIDGLIFHWYGKGESTTNVKMYYWKNTFESIGVDIIGKWVEEDIGNSGELTLNGYIGNDDVDLTLNDDNELNICIIAEKDEEEEYSILKTDYINVTIEGEDGYESELATLETKKPIEPPSGNFYWETLTWNDYERSSATVKYQLYYNKSGDYTLVEDEYVNGNSEGLTNSPVNIYDVPRTYNQLKIKATFNTNDPVISPKIFRWSITWQKDINKWQDHFNSSHRIDVKTRIKITENVTINPVSGDWPTFGQNLQNTRASEGKGASSSTEEYSYWWSKYHETKGETLSNPVISDEYLYVCANTDIEGKLYRYNIIVDNEKIGLKYEGEPDLLLEDVPPLVGSPAITDEFIIVASGKVKEEGNDDSPTNYIYAVPKDDPGNLKEYEYDGYISYWSSPIVYDDGVSISTWSGDYRLLQQSNDNNKLLALELKSDGELTLNWEYDLPTHSFSSPAIYNDMIFVGCKEASGDSIFALDIDTGTILWNESVGTIGKSSPVVYDETLFVTSQQKKLPNRYQTKITALDIYDGTILWEKTIGKVITRPIVRNHMSSTMADSTPAVYDKVLYAVIPDGTVVALSTTNGTEIWSISIYDRQIFSIDFDLKPPYLNDEYLSSSPAYADDKIYVSTPDGLLYFINANNGEDKGTKRAKPSDYTVPFITSPVVSNGLVFVAAGTGDDPSGTGNNRLYSYGLYEEPSEEIDGSLISIPIKCPPNKYWKKFYADFNASDDDNDIVFSILDANKKHIRTIANGDSLNVGDKLLDSTIRLRANLSAKNTSVNPELASWYVTFESDDHPPLFVESSFEPKDGWLDTPTPTCKIDVWDNESGLRLNSAEFEIEYYENDSSLKTHTGDAEYVGVNGTNFTTLTADILSLDFSENITRLVNITFSIKDVAYNTASKIIKLKQDTTKPTSSVSDETNGSQFTSEFVVINATAEDPGGSGIASVQLKYRHSSSRAPNFSGQWEKFGETITSAPFTWNFTAAEHGGHYELATVATDDVGNVEDEPESGDVSFILDNEKPDKPSLSEVHWFKELPTILIEFSDDFLLDTIKYRPEFETEWTLIDSGIDQATYDAEWDLDQDYWDQMADGEEYALYFWINDSLGNTQIIDEDGYKIVKDAAEPNVDLEIPSLETEWSFDDTFTIKAFATDGDGSGIKSVELFYRYSEDGDFDDVNWSSYGLLISEPFEWEFTAEEGNGYYEFYVRAEDVAGNAAESEVFSTGINIFPVFSVIAMVILIIALILITIVIIIKWRKK